MNSQELAEKQRLAHRLITDFLAIEADILGTPYFRAEIHNSAGDSFDLLIETRLRLPRKVA